MPLYLKPHGSTAFLSSVVVDPRWDSKFLIVRYVITGVTAEIAVPERAKGQRADGLWQHTCCEAFVRAKDASSYFEFNFSPSTSWAAYGFTGYREGMKALEIDAPTISTSVTHSAIELTASVELTSLRLREPLAIGLCAVVEQRSGVKSYWALEHPAEKPDFHHPGSFIPYTDIQ